MVKKNKNDKNKPTSQEKGKNQKSILIKKIKEKRDLVKKGVDSKQRQKNRLIEKEKTKKSEEKEEEEEQEEMEEEESNEKDENEEEEEIINENDKDDEIEESEEKEENKEIEDNESESDEKDNENENENEEEDDENNDEKNQNESKHPKLLQNSISEHYYTFQYPKDLYTLLYTSLIFKWIDTTKILILCETPKIGYKIDIFLRQFRFNTIYLDKEMPLNTNNHFYSQYLKNTYQICIINLEYSEKSKNFAKEILDSTKIPITIIYFDCFSKELLEYHSFHPNTRSIYHFINDKDKFLDAYEDLDENINFNEFEFDKEQMEHLKYRAEDMLNGIRKNDIKKEKMRKINIELLHSKNMQKFFKDNPKERENIIRNIEENTIKNFSPSVTFLPSYLIHSENNVIADAIKKEYKDSNKNRNNKKRRKKQKKMEQYFEALDKGDGSQNLIQF